ncbi:MAG: serine hydrolase domain-containing protein [Ekhidna sp.]
MKRITAICFILLTHFAFSSEVVWSEGIWIDGSSLYSTVVPSKGATLFFENWSEEVASFTEKDSYFVALQLDEKLDPIPDDEINLPSLKMLSAIADDSLINVYFDFLENFGRTNGINYLVLPDLQHLTDFEKKVIRTANAHSPYYFLHKSSLSHTLPNSRREFEEEPTFTIWIAETEQNTNKINRWNRKADGSNRSSFYEGLEKAKSTKTLKPTDYSEELEKSLFEKSVVAIDPNGRFPLRENAITYLGYDQALKSRLAQYVEVWNERKEGIQVIVDTRHGWDGETFDNDILISDLNGEANTTALLLPETTKSYDVIVCKMLFGAASIEGQADHLNYREVKNLQYVGFSDPESERMNEGHLRWIDSLANDAIKKFATPGIQVAVLKNGSMVLEKSYGYYSYDSLKPVTNETLYDIASLTKVIATLPAVALLVDQGKVNLDDSISMHLPEFSHSNKSHVTIKQLLSHNAGLRSYIPFWSMVMDGDRLDPFYYKTPEDEANDIRSYGIEPHPGLLDTLKSFIVKSDLIKHTQNYNYSDLGYMMLHLLVESVSGQSFDDFLSTHFYHPMELLRTTFNPREKGYSFENIAPTENDQRYRNGQVWGEVHDRNAHVFGGVAGHAGLFSNASDLSKMMSMMINNGYYGGIQYISKETLDQFNKRYFERNRRGLGWDKKDGKKDSASGLASDKSFGHTGFTGTMVWADPEADLVYIFLSNRVYPDAENWRLGKLNTRTNIHDVIYQSFRVE